MTHPAVQLHREAAGALSAASDKHLEAADAHESGDHEDAREFAAAAKQAGLDAAVKSDSAAKASEAEDPHAA
jgi:hypothetical protein